MAGWEIDKFKEKHVKNSIVLLLKCYENKVVFR